MLVTKTDAGAHTCNCSTGQPRKDILTNHCCQQRALTSSGVTNDLHRILACKVKSASRLSKVIAQLEYLLRFHLLELRPLKELSAGQCSLDLLTPEREFLSFTGQLCRKIVIHLSRLILQAS